MALEVVACIPPFGLLLYILRVLFWNHFKFFPDRSPFRRKLTIRHSWNHPALTFCGGGLCGLKRHKGIVAHGAGLFISTCGLAYCGWYSTEILYDQSIVHSFYALHL